MKTFIKKISILSILFVSVFLFQPKSTHAQLDLGLRDTDITVTSIPELPRANQSVTISISSFSIDLDKVMIIWNRDDKTIKTGMGEKSITISTGDIGTSSKIDLEIISGSDSLKKTFTVAPSEIDLLWESINSYVPPFYKGKALPVEESAVKFTAIANTTNTGFSQSDMQYVWQRNDEAMPSSSGYKKNFITVQLNYLDPSQTINVTASSLSGGYNAKNTITLTPFNPRIVYYENNPDIGMIFNRAVQNGITTKENAFEVIAAPFFFTIKSLKTDELSYSWTIGGNSVPENGVKNRLTVQFPKGATGSTLITTAVESQSKLFQSAQSSVSINKN